jgi:hypothetical protein
VKRPPKSKAIWRKAFPGQAQALRPEQSAAGGVKARSGGEARRLQVYNGINVLFAECHPLCEACPRIPGGNKLVHPREDTHHVFGKDGLLLFDVRGFMSVCRWAHTWIDTHREEARKLGLLASVGKWNKQG